MSSKWNTRQPQIQQNTREIYFWGAATKKQPIISFHFKFEAKISDTTVRKENARPNVQCWVQLSLKPISLSIRLTNIYDYLFLPIHQPIDPSTVSIHLSESIPVSRTSQN